MRHDTGFFQWLTTLPYSILGVSTGSVAAILTFDLLGAVLTIFVGVATAVLSAVGVFFTKRYLNQWFNNPPKQLDAGDSE